jgi:hypothetical protein
MTQKPTATAADANSSVDAYLAEREAKRLKGIDISRHRRYCQGDAGDAAYAGTRQVGGHSLALLKKGDEVIVMPVGEATAYRLGRLPVGAPITLQPDGSISTANTMTRNGRGR